MNYNTLLIPAAGIGSRLGFETMHLPKALVPVGTKPAISWIFDFFPKTMKKVVAIGYKGNLLREYLELAYPDQDIEIVEVNPYDGPGSGVGYSIQQCRDFCQEPFIICSCDTLLKGTFSEGLRGNWAGVSQEYIAGVQYRGFLSGQIEEKGVAVESPAYIGVCGIQDFKQFWEEMEAGGEKAVQVGEVYALNKLQVQPENFEWYDVGTPEKLQKARKIFSGEKGPNILPKENEAIWILEDKVVKYFADPKVVRDRCYRAKTLEGFVPKLLQEREYMYSYSKVFGEVFSKCVTEKSFKDLLDRSLEFWNLGRVEPSQEFFDDCFRFYKEKTYERVDYFYSRYGKEDSLEFINETRVKPLREMLDSLDWNYVCTGEPVRFHGDFHFENILKSDDGHFVFLDWRQSFGHSKDVGDVYYDLAKLYHGLIINHEIINQNLYDVVWKGTEGNYDFCRKNKLVGCEKEYIQWLSAAGFDVKKVEILTALIFLNICGLHEAPYSHLLYMLGVDLLGKNV